MRGPHPACRLASTLPPAQVTACCPAAQHSQQSMLELAIAWPGAVLLVPAALQLSKASRACLTWHCMAWCYLFFYIGACYGSSIG